MLERYRDETNSVIGETRRAVLVYFGLQIWSRSETIEMYGIMRSRRLSQADLVLALLRVNTRDALDCAERLVGRPILICPPALRGSPRLRNSSEKTPDDRMVTMVRHNPCLPTTDAFQRFRQIRCGLTVRQLMTRGLSRRDLRKFTRKEWIWLSA